MTHDQHLVTPDAFEPAVTPHRSPHDVKHAMRGPRIPHAGANAELIYVSQNGYYKQYFLTLMSSFLASNRSIQKSIALEQD